jgi:hypothetical protein
VDLDTLNDSSLILAHEVCGFPERLHPVSAMFLRYFIDGEMAANEFLRFFSLPNSDYIDLGQCIVANVWLVG